MPNKFTIGLLFGIFSANVAFASTPLFSVTAISTSGNFIKDINYGISETLDVASSYGSDYQERNSVVSSGSTIEYNWFDSAGNEWAHGVDWTKREFEYSYDKYSRVVQFAGIERTGDIDGDSFLSLSITSNQHVSYNLFGDSKRGNKEYSLNGEIQNPSANFGYSVNGGNNVNVDSYINYYAHDIRYAGTSVSEPLNTLEFFVRATDGGKPDHIHIQAYGESYADGRSDWMAGSGYQKYESFDRLVTAVPEPETYAMFLAGLALIGAAVRRSKR